MKVDTKNTKVLIVSDSHNEWQKLKKIIDTEAADIVVFAGDFNDSFIYDDNKSVAESAQYHKQLINKNNSIVLFGNHCINVNPYNNNTTRCSGYEKRKDIIVNNILTKEDWEKVKWHVIVDQYLITHAGLLPVHIEHLEDKSLGSIDDFLNRQTVKANKAMKSGTNHWFWAAGQARGGFAKHSGIVWTDWNYEFEPIPGISQICGHSNGRSVRQFGVAHPNNWCIDCHLQQYLCILNGKLEIKKYINL